MTCRPPISHLRRSFFQLSVATSQPWRQELWRCPQQCRVQRNVVRPSDIGEGKVASIAAVGAVR